MTTAIASSLFPLFGRSQTGRSLHRVAACCAVMNARLRLPMTTAGVDCLPQSAPAILAPSVQSGRWQAAPGQRAAWPGARPYPSATDFRGAA